MKRKTYNNVMKATKMIRMKGYNFEESSQMAINIFDQYKNGEIPIEWYIDKVQEKSSQ